MGIILVILGLFQQFVGLNYEGFRGFAPALHLGG